MSRMSVFNSPFLLGFDHFEQVLDRAAKAGNDGYPPYNIERISENGLCITIAVAGFSQDELDITLEHNQLSVRGKQRDDSSRIYLHRGIATRQFVRTFVLAEGIEIVRAQLDNGLLNIEMKQPEPASLSRKIEIQSGSGATGKTSQKQENLSINH